MSALGVDGCHFKTQHGGVVLVATAIDGNGNIFPVAVGTAEQECVDSWTWFLQRVRTALHIGNGNGVVVLSDMDNELAMPSGPCSPRRRTDSVFSTLRKTS